MPEQDKERLPEDSVVSTSSDKAISQIVEQIRSEITGVNNQIMDIESYSPKLIAQHQEPTSEYTNISDDVITSGSRLNHSDSRFGFNLHQKRVRQLKKGR
ncbi:hypothetical protein HYS90_00865 [Candidatus Curtissbacteria bacterium]|nr:hypothetical protein [Candidatus Curtissbacteria bacterium]